MISDYYVQNSVLISLMDPLGQLQGALAALRWILVPEIGSVRGVYAAVAQSHLSIALPGTKAPVVGPAFRR
ncbi:hypothetical protein TNCT_98451 [Trichonephila clavata]|uniref:Uncharacterized protein n=1 Tax=Trichonephila clavata TaxID=2740835 RepID=A0A8X6HCV3_TRICU|nr:hypothetical protein TNCT_98451 [Trichonephila clavata]